MSSQEENIVPPAWSSAGSDSLNLTARSDALHRAGLPLSYRESVVRLGAVTGEDVGIMMATDIAFENVEDKEKGLALHQRTVNMQDLRHRTRETLSQHRWTGTPREYVRRPRNSAARAAWARQRLFNRDAAHFYYMDLEGTVQGPFSGDFMHKHLQYFTEHTKIRYVPYGDAFFPLANAYPDSEVCFLSAPAPAVTDKRRGPAGPA